MKKLIVFILIVFSVLQVSNAQTRQERRAEKKAKLEVQFFEIKNLIDSKNFSFNANWAIPLGNDISNLGLTLSGGAGIFQGGRVSISSGSNFIKVNDTIADVFLQYFGRVFFPKLNNNDGGIRYDGTIETYEVEVNEKKKSIQVVWTANPKGDFLKFFMRINANGSASVAVTSTNRQSITYNGTISAIEKPN